MTQEGKSDAKTGGGGSGGILVPLKTAMEVRARESFIEVYVTSVPVKQASGALE